MDIVAAITSVKATVGLLDKWIETRDFIKLSELKIELQGTVLELSNSALDLMDRLAKCEAIRRDLESENTKLQNRITEMGSYEIAEVRPGGFGYKSVDSTKPMHYICQLCYDKDGIKSFLHEYFSHGKKVYVCLACKSHL